MNLAIFLEDLYFNELSKLLDIEKVDSIYPFKEMFIDPDNLIDDDGYNLTDLYNFLKDVHFFYYHNQSHYGYVQINGSYYIVEVGDECNVLILGNDEVNWTKLLLDDDKYLEFKQFCLLTYNILAQDPDYKKLGDVSRESLNF